MSKVETSSYVVIPAHEAKKIARANIDHIEAVRLRKKTAAITAHQEHLNRPRWWHRFFKARVYTAEEAEKDLRRRSGFFPQIDGDIYAWGTLEKADRLLAASRLGVDVRLSIEDAQELVDEEIAETLVYSRVANRVL